MLKIWGVGWAAESKSLGEVLDWKCVLFCPWSHPVFPFWLLWIEWLCSICPHCHNVLTSQQVQISKSSSPGLTVNSEPESTCALCCFLSGLLGMVMLKLSNKDPIAILAALLILGTVGPFLSVSLPFLICGQKTLFCFPSCPMAG